MTPAEITIFNAAVALANQGEKQTAHAQLSVLESTNPNEVSLLLWLAFTAPTLDQAEALLIRASSIDPTNPSLAQAKSWLVQEKAKQAPPVVQPAPVAPVAPAAYNYNWPTNLPGGPAPYGMPPGQPPYNQYYYPEQSGYYAPYTTQPSQTGQRLGTLGFAAGCGYYMFYFMLCNIVSVILTVVAVLLEPAHPYYINGHYQYGKDFIWGAVVSWVIITVSSIWAAIDAANWRERYGKRATSHPALVFFGCFLMWGCVFPGYLSQRHRPVVNSQLTGNWARFN